MRLVVGDERLEAISFAILDKGPRCLLQLVSISDSGCIGTELYFHGIVELRHDRVLRIEVVPVASEDPVSELRVAVNAVLTDKLDVILGLEIKDRGIDSLEKQVIVFRFEPRLR